MPPKKKAVDDRSDASDTEGRPTKQRRTETSGNGKKLTKKQQKEEHDRLQAENAKKWLKENEDPMVEQDPDLFITVDHLFTKVAASTSYLDGETRREWDWSLLKDRLKARSEDSEDTWFIHARRDDLTRGEHGTIGIKVDNFVVAATKTPTLAPMNLILKDHRSYADIEDNAPERVFPLSAQKLKWIRVVLDAESKKSLKAFVLYRPDDLSNQLIAAGSLAGDGLKKSVSMFGFGGAAPAPAPAAAASPTADNAPVASSPSFGAGFGGSAAPPAANTTVTQSASSFGLPTASSTGSAPVAAAAPPVAFSSSFGFPANAEKKEEDKKPEPERNASGGSFGFGFSGAPAAAPLPMAAAKKDNDKDGGTSFGFGNVAPVAQADGPQRNASSFGFGQPAASTTTTGGDDQAAAPSPQLAERSATTFGGAAKTGDDQPAMKTIKLQDIVWVLWSNDRCKELLKDQAAGTRAVEKDFNVPDFGKVKVIVDNDMAKGGVAKSAVAVVDKYYCKQNDEMKELGSWIDDCPIVDDIVMDACQNLKAKMLKKHKKEEDEYTEVSEKLLEPVTKRMEEIVAVRKDEIGKEADCVQHAVDLLDAKKLAAREDFQILKFYPKNDVGFRAWGKATGLTLEGQKLDECHPAPFVQSFGGFRKS